MAICAMAVVGLAPCQCFSPGGIHTVSPGLISRIGPPQVYTRPSPATTWRVWPSGWVCHAVRAPGSKLTRAARMRAGAGASMIGSCHTVPVNQSPGIRRDGTDPDSLMSMISPQQRLFETATATSPRHPRKGTENSVSISSNRRCAQRQSVMHGRHVVVEVVHDPERAADDQRDDQHAESERHGIVGIVRGRREVEK